MPSPLRPCDAEKVEEVYIDETSQTGHRNLIIGGIVLPHRFSRQFEQVILEARRPKLAAERAGADELCEMGWSEVGKGGFEAYKRVVDAYFDFADKHIKSSEGTIEFHCSVVLTQVRGRTFSGERGRTHSLTKFFSTASQSPDITSRRSSTSTLTGATPTTANPQNMTPVSARSCAVC